MLDFLSMAAAVRATTRTPEAGALLSVRRFRVGIVVSTSTAATARLESGQGVCGIPEKWRIYSLKLGSKKITFFRDLW